MQNGHNPIAPERQLALALLHCAQTLTRVAHALSLVAAALDPVPERRPEGA